MENLQKVSLTSPYASRLWAWAGERFPPIHVITSWIVYLMTASAVRGSHASAPISFSTLDVLVAIGVTAQFLLLRILDEHKDYEEDCLNHPERALQRGLITLRDLRRIGIGCAGLMLALSVFYDGGVGRATFAWAMMSAWTFLMFKEFFLRDWLRARLFIYALSHMLIMPLVMLWMVALCSSETPWSDPVTLLLMALTLISGFAFEITRKTKGRDEERDGVDTYSRRIGANASGTLIITLIPGIFLIQVALVRTLEMRYAVVFWGLSLVTAIVAVLSVAAYRKDPTASARKKNEGATGLFMLMNYLSLIIGPALTHGWKWH